MDAASRQLDTRPGFGVRLAGFARWMFLFAVAVGALVVIGGTLAYKHLDEEIRAHVEQRFRLHYAPMGLVVHIGSARRVEGKGIELRDVRLIQPGLPAADSVVAHIGEGFIVCRTDLQDLLAGDLEIGHVTVRRLKVHTTRDEDGSWNARRLFPLPRFGTQPPQGTVEGATVEIVDNSSEQGSLITLRDVNVQIFPEESEEEANAPAGESSGFVLRVKGSFTGEHFDRITVDGAIDSKQGYWNAQGVAEGVQISPALRASLPREAADQLAPLAALRGRLQLDYRLTHKLSAGEPTQFVVAGKLTEGQIEDPRLPYPLTEIEADVYCDNHGLKVDRMTARSGLGAISLNCRREGFAENSPLVLTAKLRQVELDARLAKVLPPELRSQWDKLSPSGLVHADLSLAFDGHRWQPNLKIDCVDVSFAYYKFPYRVQGCLGVIHLKDNTLTIRLRALAAGQVVRLDGDFQNPGADYTGALAVTVEGPIPLDEALLAALDARSRQVIRSLHPRGSVTASARFERRKKGREAVLRQHAKIVLHDCAVKYEKFPYPLERIRGTLEFNDGRWEFKDLKAHNDSAYITCQGSWVFGPGGGLLKLDFVGTDVPMEEELQHALSSQSQQIWTQMRPRGTIDYLKVGLTYASAAQDFTLTVAAQKWKQQQNLEGRSISIEPAGFPYRLDQVTGSVHYRDGQVLFKNVAAVHGTTGISLDGKCDFSSDGNWRVLLERVTADRVRCDHDLLAALPAELRGNVARLNLTGPMSVQGALELQGNARENGPPQARWDALFDLENGGVECGVKLEHIHGGVRLAGSHDGRTLRTRGELQIDSVVHKDLQFTNVAGPVWIDGSQVIFGSKADAPSRGAVPRRASAKLYGGTLLGDVQVSLGGNGEFDVDATLADADLAILSQELIHTQRPVAGKASGSVRLVGNSRGTHTWRGGGTVRLRDADIYEVPVMLALLKLLSIRRPDTTAFNNGDIDFRIQGDRFYFDRFDFKGDAITLKGNGEMDLDRNLNLQFYTLVGRDEVHVPVITPMLGLASQQLLLIQVGGTVDNPELNKKAFPGLNDTLKQLFPEAQEAKTWSGPVLVSPLEALKRSGLMPGR